ncbi:hypothetical protein C2857_003668 [Epichloe festucae Fl1]|uniref:Uncharacterized protein n=1 Tax=Epichloe festucae (strain Fl1) TaxID=877507 RepID=A0A7S9KS46_EPIFF|nr:hypothetical protein C2857_003668 [Epichloe festucae Fl1]
MCNAIRTYRCGRPLKTTERVKCGRPPPRERDGFVATTPDMSFVKVPCPQAYLWQQNWEEDEDCPHCDADASGSTQARNSPGRSYVESPINMNALEIRYSREAAQFDDVSALNRDSLSTWINSAVVSMDLRSSRSSTDFASSVCEKQRMIVVPSSPNALQADFAVGDLTPSIVSCSLSAVPSALSLGRDYNTRKSPTSLNSTSPVLSHHRQIFAKFLGWKQTKPSEQQDPESEPKGSSPEKQTRKRWKAILSRNKSVDSDNSFVCKTAWQIENLR